MKSHEQPGGNEISRRSFFQISAAFAAGFLLPEEALAESSVEKIPKTHLVPTEERFINGEFVYELQNAANGRIGEFWPVHTMNLVTKETDPGIFNGHTDDLLVTLKGVATAPDGMTTGYSGKYKMEGRALAGGRECGDGKVYDYGIVIADKKGVTFTHAREHQTDFESLYTEAKKGRKNLFFLPSIFRNGKFLSSANVVDKVLVRRETSRGTQIGVIHFDSLKTYNEARLTVLGLNRPGASKTTHIYSLDGGPTWGESAKDVEAKGSRKIIKRGTSDKNAVTNYLVFY
ncbi:MAG: hypothetical protein WC101_00340 [Candidatus Gracilibacteria bacterium]